MSAEISLGKINVGEVFSFFDTEWLLHGLKKHFEMRKNVGTQNGNETFACETSSPKNTFPSIWSFRQKNNFFRFFKEKTLIVFEIFVQYILLLCLHKDASDLLGSSLTVEISLIGVCACRRATCSAKAFTSPIWFPRAVSSLRLLFFIETWDRCFSQLLFRDKGRTWRIVTLVWSGSWPNAPMSSCNATLSR